MFLAAFIAQAASPQPNGAPTATIAPSPTASATPSAAPLVPQPVGVSVPSAWKAQSVKPSNAPARRIGVWVDASGDGEALTLDVSPTFGLDLKHIVEAATNEMKRQAGVTILSSGPFALCNGRQGWKQTYHDSSGLGMTFVFALTRSRAYVATYEYPAYPGPLASGEAAAESLCPPLDRDRASAPAATRSAR